MEVVLGENANRQERAMPTDFLHSMAELIDTTYIIHGKELEISAPLTEFRGEC